MNHSLFLSLFISLCCIAQSGCGHSSQSLPAPTEAQLLHALQRMDSTVQSIKLEKCNKDKPYGGGTAGVIDDMWTCRAHVRLDSPEHSVAEAYVDVHLHLNEYHAEGWLVDWVDLVNKKEEQTHVQ